MTFKPKGQTKLIWWAYPGLPIAHAQIQWQQGLNAKTLSIHSIRSSKQLLSAEINSLDLFVVSYGKPSVTIFPVHYDYIKLPKNCHIMALCHNIMTIISQYYDLVLVTILGPIILCHTGIYHHIMTHNIMPQYRLPYYDLL